MKLSQTFHSFLCLTWGKTAHPTGIILQKHRENSPHSDLHLSLFITNSLQSFQTMAGVILCHILETLCSSASSWAMQGLREAWDADVDGEIENLKSKLSTIQAVLEDAEEQQFESRAIKDWLQKLKQVAYDADDVVDEVDAEAQQSQSAESGNSCAKKWKQVWDYFLSFLSSSNSQQDLTNRIRDINARLEEIAGEKRDLHLENRQGSKQLEIISRERRLVSSVRDESSKFVGRTEDTEQIMKWLMSDDDSGNTKFSVVGIVGMGGVGKTTLAQVVYNDKTVTEKFEVKAWVCVSEHFDVERVTKEIIGGAGKSTSDLSGLDKLQCCLREIVNGKKYLVVLDDVWSEDSSEWERLQAPLTFGARGSRIMVTTRSRAVLYVMQTTWTRDLKGLCQKDCRSLFVSRAFKDEEESKAYPKLLEIGEKLVKKCGGLPLAAKAVGGLLACTRQEGEWENILKSRIWNLKGSAGNIIPALRLSYEHLPAHLKRCFTFCSVFPKDYVFEKENIVNMWIAHGFICREEGKEIEETGSEYFNDLLLRSFFQSQSDEYKMHDLVHDLAQFISGHECFEEEEDKSHDDPSKIRHLSCTLLGAVVGEDCLANLEPFYESRGLRTLLVLNGTAASKLPQESFERLRLIRVLDLSRTSIAELPNSIGNLKLLRYLNLSYTHIKELPDSICSIYSMKTLLLRGCSNLIELPNEIRRLIHLRHLDVHGCSSIISMPPEIGRLVCLQKLPSFVLGRDRESGIAELKELGNIHGRLKIEKLENVAYSEDSRQANLKNKPSIDELVLLWSENRTHNSQDKGVEEEIANGLQPHPNLKSLRFHGYQGAQFPSWMMKVDVLMLLSNLVSLKLYNCRRCSTLPPLGCLPLLSVLYIWGMDEVKQMGHAVCGMAGGGGGGGGFPSLKKLFISNMVNLEHWHENKKGDFPCLEILEIYNCPQLRQMPSTPLFNLKMLNIQKVHNLEQVKDNFSCLEELIIQNCTQLRQIISNTLLLNLKKIDIRSMDNLEQVKGDFPCLEELIIWNCPQLREITSSTFLPNLKKLTIQKVHNLEQVEGDFPYLEELIIQNCSQLRQITSNNPLLNLKMLDIQNMHNLEQVENDFPCLEELIIRNCHQLRRIISSTPLSNLKMLDIQNVHNLEQVKADFHCLEELSISNCPHLLRQITSNTSLPNLKKLDIQNMHNLEQVEGDFPYLENLSISECPQLRQMTSSIPFPGLKKLNIQNIHNLEQVEGDFPCLEVLIIYDCPRLRQMTNSTPFFNLKKLDIQNMHNLEKVEGDFPCLEELKIYNCPQLRQIISSTPLPNLKSLYIRNVYNLEQMEGGFPCLEKLSISECPQPRQMTNSTPLPNLKYLDIQNVDNLEWAEGDFPCLELLCIYDCPQLRQMTNSTPLPNLKKLHIQNLDNLEQVKGDFPCLEILEIYNCPKLRQMPSTTLSNLKKLHIQNVHKLEQVKGDFPCLKELFILNCPQLRQMTNTPLTNLKKLYIQNVHNLEVEGDFSCLEELWIYNCPQLRQILSTSLPNLAQLYICMCEGFQALPLLPSLNKLRLIGDISEGVLKSVACLTSLSSLTISHLPNRTSLPRGMLQPLTQLKHLEIESCPQLVTLLEEENGGLQDQHHHLPSTLTELCFSECPNLQSLPRRLHALICLQMLRVEDCPCVTWLPEEGLPHELQTLEIRECPDEFERCVKDLFARRRLTKS